MDENRGRAPCVIVDEDGCFIDFRWRRYDERNMSASEPVWSQRRPWFPFMLDRKDGTTTIHAKPFPADPS